MKTNLQMSRMVLVAFLLLSAVLVSAQPNEKPEQQRRVKMVKIENGQKIVLDTLITGDEADFAWIDELDLRCPLDSSLKRKLNRFRYEFSDGDNAEVFGFGPGHRQFMRHRGNRMVIRDCILEGDSLRTRMMIRRGDGPIAPNRGFRHKQGFAQGPRSPYPAMRMLYAGRNLNDKMVIHLNDPNVVSYNKEDLSGGREKIEIIRKKQNEQMHEFEEEIIIEEDE